MANTVLENNIATFVHRAFFWETPYRTGNLARSIGDVGIMDSGIGFELFNQNQRAPYGKLLNEQKQISYKSINQETGKQRFYSYINKHYQWVDRGMEEIANVVAISFNLRRII